MEALKNGFSGPQSAFEAVQAGFGHAMKGYEQWIALGNSGAEAVVESSKIVTMGAEAITKELNDYTRQALDRCATATKTLFATRAPTDFAQLPATLSGAAYEDYFAHVTRLMNLFMTTGQEAWQLFGTRFATMANSGASNQTVAAE